MGMDMKWIAFGLALSAAAAASPAPAEDADPIEAPECPRDATEHEVGDLFNCYCAPGYADDPVAVWGSGPYTHDSGLCVAARHAGLIGESGGMITVRVLEGCESYRGNTANGVVTEPYGEWLMSFHFPGVTAPGCAGGPPE